MRAPDGTRASAGARDRPSLWTAAASAALLAVGAAYWGTPDTIEPFSSQGPTRDGRVKPDIIGADGGDSVTYGAFPGTSQSAPPTPITGAM